MQTEHREIENSFGPLTVEDTKRLIEDFHRSCSKLCASLESMSALLCAMVCFFLFSKNTKTFGYRTPRLASPHRSRHLNTFLIHFFMKFLLSHFLFLFFFISFSKMKPTCSCASSHDFEMFSPSGCQGEMVMMRLLI